MEGRAITTDVIRSAIKVEGLVPDAAELRKKSIPLKLVTCLEFSFRRPTPSDGEFVDRAGIKEIDYLMGFECLTKLLLDNNCLSEIKNIDHLPTLTHLDLSFNEITKIEGLATLTRLVDLSLYNNKIETLEGLETLEDLISLSLGNNLLKELEDVIYFRQFRKLRLLCLEGNPISKKQDYRYYVIAFAQNLLYLDHKLCFQKQITAAKEQFQDDLQELKSSDLKQDAAMKERKDKRAEKELLKKANLDTLDELFDAMLAEDPEYMKLAEVPNLLEAHEEYREKFLSATADLKVVLIDLHYKQQAEIKDWKDALKRDVTKKDEESRQLVRDFEELKKKVFREAHEERTTGEAKLRNLTIANDRMKEALMELEVICFDEVQYLWTQFEQVFFGMIDVNKQHFANYFGVLRQAELKSSETIAMQAASLVEKYVLQDMEEDVESEIARDLLKDKETLMMAIAASKDAHTLKLDSTEDEKMKNEELVKKTVTEEAKLSSIRRNRERIQELWFVHEANAHDIDLELRRAQRGDASHRSHLQT